MSNASGGYPVPANNREWLGRKFRELNGKIAEVNRGVRAAHQWASRVAYGTVVDENLHSRMPAQPNTPLVLLDGDDTPVRATLVDGTANGWVPWAGDRVAVIRDTVDGYIALGRVIPQRYVIENLTGSNVVFYDNFWEEPSIYLTSDGFAVWQGIGLPAIAMSGETQMFTLPPELIPDIPTGTRIRFGSQSADTPQYLDLYWDGRVIMSGTISARGSYIGFGGVAYPTKAAGLTWTNVAPQGTTGTPAFANGWTDLGSTASGTPFVPCRWAVDAWGIMWWQGSAKAPSTLPATNTAAIALDAAHLPLYQHHFPTVTSAGAFHMWGADTGGGRSGQAAAGINFKTGGAIAGGGNATLANVRLQLAGNKISFYNWQPGNSWIQFTTGSPNIFPPVQIGKRGEMVMTRGLAGAGTIGQYLTPIPKGTRPPSSLWNTSPTTTAGILLLAASSDARGRMDVTGPGLAIATQGSSTWFAFDGHVWIPEG